MRVQQPGEGHDVWAAGDGTHQFTGPSGGHTIATHHQVRGVSRSGHYTPAQLKHFLNNTSKLSVILNMGQLHTRSYLKLEVSGTTKTKIIIEFKIIITAISIS